MTEKNKKQPAPQTKKFTKKYFKKWWFWILIIIILLATTYQIIKNKPIYCEKFDVDNCPGSCEVIEGSEPSAFDPVSGIHMTFPGFSVSCEAPNNEK